MNSIRGNFSTDEGGSLYTLGTPEFPVGLKSAEDVATATGLPLKQLVELTEALFVPHYRCGDGDAMYKMKEVKDWLAENMIIRFHGQRFPHKIAILDYVEPAKSAPDSIKHIQGLCDVKCSLPGVYFLVDGNALVYIGQSLDPSKRVASHTQEGKKKFTHAYYVPIVKSQLDSVEGALIRFFQPKYNISIHGRVVAPPIVDDENALTKLGIPTEVSAL